jgi:hypothetical protein
MNTVVVVSCADINSKPRPAITADILIGCNASYVVELWTINVGVDKLKAIDFS